MVTKRRKLLPPSRPKQETLRPALVERQKELMLMTLIRLPDAFQLAKDRLKAEHFELDEEDAYLGIIWDCVCRLHEKWERLPDFELLSSEVEAEIGLLGDEVSDDQVTKADNLINNAFAKKRTQLRRNSTQALEHLQQLLEENLQHDLHDKMSRGTDVVHDMLDLLSANLEKAQAIKSLKAGMLDDLFPDNLEQVKSVEKVSTGCTFLDYYMRGQAAGEVYGFLAPYGVCKTTLAIQLAVERVRYEQKKWRKNGCQDPLPIVYTVFWEEEIESVRHRVLAYAAQVERTVLEDGRWNELSSSKDRSYKPYEKEMWREQFRAGVTVPGERERLDKAKKQMNRNFKVIDFTGAKLELREHAANFVDGVVATIEADQAHRGHPGVSMVVMDYAGAAAERYIQERGLDPDRNLRHLVGKMPLRVKNQIALPYRCPVWLMHQLGTQANSRSSSVAPKLTDAAEAKNFPENCNFVYMVGQKTLSNLCILTNVKQRRSEKKPDTVIEVDGLFSAVRSTGNTYAIDGAGGGIVRSEDRGRLATPDEFEDADFNDDYAGDSSFVGL